MPVTASKPNVSTTASAPRSGRSHEMTAATRTHSARAPARAAEPLLKLYGTAGAAHPTRLAAPIAKAGRQPERESLIRWPFAMLKNSAMPPLSAAAHTACAGWWETIMPAIRPRTIPRPSAPPKTAARVVPSRAAGAEVAAIAKRIGACTVQMHVQMG
jgi:hypothetical protein